MPLRFHVNGDIFEKAAGVEAAVLYTDEKMRFQKNPDTCVRGLRYNPVACLLYSFPLSHCLLLPMVAAFFSVLSDSLLRNQRLGK